MAHGAEHLGASFLGVVLALVACGEQPRLHPNAPTQPNTLSVCEHKGGMAVDVCGTWAWDGTKLVLHYEGRYTTTGDNGPHEEVFHEDGTLTLRRVDADHITLERVDPAHRDENCVYDDPVKCTIPEGHAHYEGHRVAGGWIGTRTWTSGASAEWEALGELPPPPPPAPAPPPVATVVDAGPPEVGPPDYSEFDKQEFAGVVHGDEAIKSAFSLACTASGAEVCGNAIDDDCDGTYDASCGWAVGSLQWTLAWSTSDDLDLHVVGPDGVEVWAGHMTGGAAGVTMDRDCKGKFGPPCEGGNVENAYVARNTKPFDGAYQIWVEVAQADDALVATGAAGTRKIDLRLAGRVAGKTYSMPLSLLAQNRTRLYWSLALGADADKDGVDDKGDACPNDAGRWSSVADERGCPDRDGDGVADKVDACPDEAGIRASDGKQNGCPHRYGKAKVTALGVEISEAILFSTGSAQILAKSHALLHDVATAMKTEPDRLKKLLLEGHTDNAGTPAGNVKLSRERVTAVRDWLVKNEQISADRMELAWYGQDKPIDTNDTEAGRARNRRVVFRVIDPPPTAPPSW